MPTALRSPQSPTDLLFLLDSRPSGNDYGRAAKCAHPQPARDSVQTDSVKLSARGTLHVRLQRGRGHETRLRFFGRLRRPATDREKALDAGQGLSGRLRLLPELDAQLTLPRKHPDVGQNELRNEDRRPL